MQKKQTKKKKKKTLQIWWGGGGLGEEEGEFRWLAKKKTRDKIEANTAPLALGLGCFGLALCFLGSFVQ